MSAGLAPPLGPTVLAVHGGACSVDPAAGPPDRLAAASVALAAALRAGVSVLGAGGPAVDAVVAAVIALEDSGVFHAGRGSVPTDGGGIEMDAALADGHRRRAGGVAALREVRNPVAAARAVLEGTPYVLLSGEGALALATAAGLPVEPDAYFLRRPLPDQEPAADDTVGAVARDDGGHLAAATSTGGQSGKRAGRVGDSPVPGAGIWADDRTCAVAATGKGEAFLLAAFAHEVDALLRLGGRDLDRACREALEAVRERDGRGGCVAVDAAGRVVMPFTSAGMYRGVADLSGRVLVGSGPGPLVEAP